MTVNQSMCRMDRASPRRTTRSLPAVLITPLLGFTLACTGAGGPPGGAVGENPDGAADQRPDRGPAARACRPLHQVSARPRSIAETVELLNDLPRPVTVACLLESLDRPLYLNATRSFISLQPAAGPHNPRLFLMFEGMSLSVVPQGEGSKLIEFGQFVSPERTLKAELATPITTELRPADPYTSPKATSGPSAGLGTKCRTCHAEEERAEQIDFAEAFHSLALRPDPRSRLSVDSVLEERNACPDEDTGERCTILRALFDHGPVLPRDFPATLPTIFD
jgi:hypothetical protein